MDEQLSEKSKQIRDKAVKMMEENYKKVYIFVINNHIAYSIYQFY
jgi:hypothetical protein